MRNLQRFRKRLIHVKAPSGFLWQTASMTSMPRADKRSGILERP